MKKISTNVKVILLLFVSLAAQHKALAGFGCTTRSSCHWYADKYTCSASVTHCGGVDYNKNGSCSYASAYAHKCDNPPCVWESVNNSGGGVHANGAVVSEAWCSGRGTSPSDLFSSIRDQLPVDRLAYEKSNFNMDEPQMAVSEKGTITLTGISGSIEIGGSITRESLEIILWMPQDDSTKKTESMDTVIPPEKTLWKAGFEVFKGKLTTTGGFSASDFSVATVRGVTRVTYNNLSKTINLRRIAGSKGPMPADLAVTVRGNADPSESSAFDWVMSATKKEMSGSGAFKFNMSPKRVSTQLNIDFSDNGQKPKSIKIYDLSGRLVADLTGDIKPSGDTRYQLDIARFNLPPSYYFVEVTGNEKYIQKIMVTNAKKISAEKKPR